MPDRPLPWSFYIPRIVLSAVIVASVATVGESAGAAPWSYQGYALAVTLALLQMTYLVGAVQARLRQLEREDDGR